MTRDDWLRQFEDELKKLRPHVGDRLATTLALTKYDSKEHPRDMARQYDKVQRRESTLSAPTKKRSKRQTDVMQPSRVHMKA
jgi:hypothetical protein